MNLAKEEEDRNFKKLQNEFGMTQESRSFGEQSISGMERAVHQGEMSVMDYHERRIDLRQTELNGMDDQSSMTRGIMPTLRRLCSITNDTARAYFISGDIDHYGSSYGDKGWGCGYRNLQMLLSSLVRQEESLTKLSKGNNLQDLHVPSVESLQKGIEKAWSQGFDKAGGEQLGQKLYHTRKWIGATEIVAFLSANQIRSQIFDFHRPSGSEGTHPLLFKWVQDYFQNPRSIEQTFFTGQNGEPFLPPLYLQHQGHSRTIVGMEVLKDSSLRLLILDPSHPQDQIRRGFSSSNARDTRVLRLLRKKIHSIKSRQYQIVAVTGTYSTEGEASLHKVITSTRIS